MLDKCDLRLFEKTKCDPAHPLYGLMPKVKDSSRRLRNKTSQLPRVNTERFKDSFINRLSFKQKLAIKMF